MGLLNELNTINRTLENNQRELTKTQLKEKEKKNQEIVKKIMLENFTSYFESMQNLEQIQILTKNFIKNKTKNINVLIDFFEDTTGEQANKKIIDYMDENYYKFMIQAKKDIETIYKIDKIEYKKQKLEEEKQRKELEKLIERQQQEDERQQQIKERAAQKEYIQKQKEKQIAFNNFIIALKTITFILASPFILIMFFVWGICKNIK